ncbi:MAG: protein kinase [Ruminococcus sp.]|nr:protein kinase [Ruminococcus sp.]
MDLLQGTTLTTVNNQIITVLNKIGSGGQGDVYRCQYLGGVYALKWYHKNILKKYVGFEENLKENAASGPPTQDFLWPLDVTNDYDGVFGYVMPLIPASYRSFSDFLLAKCRFSSLTAMIDSALGIISGFRELHKRGYSYQDINDGNFFIEPETGRVLICDNDNIAPYGENLGIAGKCRYMAPEVVLGEKLPDVSTDKYSLSVILFMLIFMNHPLEGKGTMPPCMTENLERRYYAESPVFIYDKSDDSNRPVRGVHANVTARWDVFPEEFREAFTYSFSETVLQGREPRTIEKEWLKLFLKLKSQIIPCGGCGGETFYNPEKGKNVCINCGTKINLPVTLKTEEYNIPLYPGKHIFEFEIYPGIDDFKETVGIVTKGSKNPNLWGLRNISNDTWTTWDNQDEEQTTKSPNEVIRIKPGISIDFNGTIGNII